MGEAKGLPWDHPDATPLEDVLEAIRVSREHGYHLWPPVGSPVEQWYRLRVQRRAIYERVYRDDPLIKALYEAYGMEMPVVVTPDSHATQRGPHPSVMWWDEMPPASPDPLVRLCTQAVAHG